MYRRDWPFDANGRGLMWNNHYGTIPTELGRLSTLETMLMDGNNFEGTLPPGLEAMTGMVMLYVKRSCLCVWGCVCGCVCA